MKKFAFIVVAAMLVAALIPAVSACGNADRTEELHAELESMGYTLAFEDNFDGDEIDYTKWRVGYNVGAGEDGALRRAGYYEVSDDTIDVSDGVLTVSTLYQGRAIRRGLVHLLAGIERARQHGLGGADTLRRRGLPRV